MRASGLIKCLKWISLLLAGKEVEAHQAKPPFNSLSRKGSEPPFSVQFWRVHLVISAPEKVARVYTVVGELTESLLFSQLFKWASLLQQSLQVDSTQNVCSPCRYLPPHSFQNCVAQLWANYGLRPYAAH